MTTDPPQPRRDVLFDIRSLLPPTLKVVPISAAVKSLACALEGTERPVSLVSGTREDLTLGQRSQLLLVTDRALIIASLRGGPAQRMSYSDIESFSSRNSNPASYILDFVTLGLSKSLSCHYVIRLRDGQRIPFANVHPERRGFTIARRISWYRRRAGASTLQSERLAHAAQAASQATGGLLRRVKVAAEGHMRAPVSPVEDRDEVTRDDILAQLAALHEAGLLTADEVMAKKAELDSGDADLSAGTSRAAG